MEANNQYLQIQVNEIEKRSLEIDELKAAIEMAKAEGRNVEYDQLHTELQLVREYLTQAIFSLRAYETLMEEPDHV